MIFIIILIIIIIFLILAYLGASSEKTKFEVAFSEIKIKLNNLRKEFISDKHKKQEKEGKGNLCVKKFDKIVYDKK
jgi:predicted Holliday junction resolvase-like endonuclease